MTIVFSPSARLDMEDLHASIALRSPAQASNTLARMRKSINRLELFPRMGRPGAVEGTYELIIGGLPYRAVYQIVRDQVVIERILHTSMQWPPIEDANQP